MLTLVSVDKLCCPDGCTDLAPQAADHLDERAPDGHEDVSTCVLCVMGVEAAIELKPLQALGFTGTATPLSDSRIPLDPAFHVYHPPRPIAA
jgi:hypothetical protein